MVDYNQSLSVAEAIRRVQLLEEETLVWVEEPTRADDFAGHARIAAECRTPIQIGENLWGPHDLTKSLSAGASDFVMLDVMKIGGITGWLWAIGQIRGCGFTRVESSISGNQRAASSLFTTGALARISGLGGTDLTATSGS